jgi:hypothetical protein
MDGSKQSIKNSKKKKKVRGHCYHPTTFQIKIEFEYMAGGSVH